MTQTVKNPPARRETQVKSLGREEPREEEMFLLLQCSFLGNPMDRGAWGEWIHVCG